jgi:hypothetical protein
MSNSGEFSAIISARTSSVPGSVSITVLMGIESPIQGFRSLLERFVDVTDSPVANDAHASRDEYRKVEPSSRRAFSVLAVHLCLMKSIPQGGESL